MHGGCDSSGLDANYPPPPVIVGRRGGGEGWGGGFWEGRWVAGRRVRKGRLGSRWGDLGGACL